MFLTAWLNILSQCFFVCFFQLMEEIFVFLAAKHFRIHKLINMFGVFVEECCELKIFDRWDQVQLRAAGAKISRRRGTTRE